MQICEFRLGGETSAPFRAARRFRAYPCWPVVSEMTSRVKAGTITGALSVMYVWTALTAKKLADLNTGNKQSAKFLIESHRRSRKGGGCKTLDSPNRGSTVAV